MDEETQTLEIREPVAPESLVPSVGATPWVVGGILLLALAAAFVIWRTRKKRLAADPAAIRRAAYLEAGNALDKVEAATAREAAVRCSLIIRRYLATAAEDPALFETHEEFIARHDALADYTPVARQACAEGFARLAALKYAPVPENGRSTGRKEEAESQAAPHGVERGAESGNPQLLERAAPANPRSATRNPQPEMVLADARALLDAIHEGHPES